jgi:NhaP-type Na+/H+ or K+/H+ antiporter
MSAGAGQLIALVAGIIALGVCAQVLGDRYRIPSILFLLTVGVILGPISGLVGTWLFGEPFGGIITADTFGGALPAIVGLSVAIIVFEGAFHLHIDRLREAPAATLRLVTIGAVIALLGTAAAVKFALGIGWSISFLIGALLVATGPTVIAPILAVVPVRDRVGAALETEGIVNDVTAAILAVVIFEAIIADVSDPAALLELFGTRLGAGLLVGAIVAGVIFYVLRYVDLSPENAPKNARLLTLAGALVAYGGAELIVTEAGIAAVATAGILLGNVDIPYEEDITEFKGDITLLVLSFVFIALAALLDLDNLFKLGLGGIAVVAAVIILVRPALVFLSTIGGRFTFGERVFVSFVGPRGIIPASVATLFAIELEAAGFTEQADVLVGTVFLVIIATVVLQAGLARPLAAKLNIIPMRVIIVGGGQVGRTLASRLEDRGENVVIVEQDKDVIEIARNAGHAVHIGDGTDTATLREAGADNAKIVVAATGDDDVNLLVAQLANSKFDPETVLARANDPENVDAFEELGVRTVAPVFATAQELDDLIERPALSDWRSGLGDDGDIQEIEVTSEELVGMTLRELGPELPESCLVALLRRDGETRVPKADETLQAGDRITLLGRKEAVREAMAWCHPE